MKKWIGLALTIVLLLASSVVLAEAALLPGGETKGQSTTIDIDDYGKTFQSNVLKRDAMANWYIVEAPSNGTYALTIRNTELTYVTFELFDSYGKRMEGNTIGLNGTQTYTWNAMHGDSFYFYGEKYISKDGAFEFSVCFDGYHDLKPGCVTTQAATCTKEGKETASCRLCGQEVVISTPATGHIAGEWRIDKPAACTESGVTAQHCAVCDEVLASDVIAAIGHDQGEQVVALAPICLSPGKQVLQCTMCSAILSSQDLPKIDHQPGAMTVIRSASCLSEGYGEQRCTFCNALLNSETTPALGHQIGEWEIIRPAACLQSGERQQKCLACGAVLNSEILEAYDHAYTEWSVTTQATKDHAGESTRFCVLCGDKQIEVIEQLPKFLGIL